MPGAAPTDSFAARFERIARADPGRAAILGAPGGAPIRFGDLAGQVARMAGWLHRAGIAPGQMVALLLRDEVCHLLASLALLRLGCGQLALGSHEPPALRAELAARTGAVVLLAEAAEDALPGLPLLRLAGEAVAADPALAAAAPAAPGGGLLVLTSSGTTGRPKLIPLPEAALLAQSARRAGLGAVRHRPVGIEHNNSRRFALYTLANGDTLLLPGASRRMGLDAVCRAFGVEMLGLSPHAAAALLETSRDAPWPEATLIDLAGSAAGGGLVARLQAGLTRRLQVIYGSTEVGTITRAGPAELAADPDAVGAVLPGAELAVVDEAGTPLPPGETGLIRLRAAGMATAYLDDPAATARAFRDGWFQPGDMGRIDAAGRVTIAGRADDMMMLGTVNIFPAEIERVAAGFPGVAECAAFALRSAALGDIPALAVVAAPGPGPDVPALLAQCRARLGLRAPRKVVVVPALPRSAAGKVLRRELAEAARAMRQGA